MNRSAENIGSRKKRSPATPTVAPVTRAIRAALAVSATALALSVPVVGLAAGTCSYDTTSNTQVCNGGFNQRIFFSAVIADANLAPPVDLTVVPGDQLPSSVNPEAAGIDGIRAGDASIFTDAGSSSDTSGAFWAMDVGSVDDVTLVDSGDAFAADASSIQNAITANAFSLHSDISVDHLLDGTFAPGYGTLDTGFEGVINADSVNDGAHGTIATAGNSVAIDNGSDISVSGYGNVFGLDIFDGDSVSFTNGADISAEAGVGAGYWGTGAYATGVRVNAMDAAVSNHGGISATASAEGYTARARGIDSFGYSLGSTVNNAGDINANAQADGGVARAFGVYSFGYATSSTVDNVGEIHASAQAVGGRSYATAINSVAYGYSGGRDSTITNSGTLSAYADADLAYAITVFNIATGQYGNAYVANTGEGNIHADASGDFTTATGVINQATRYGSAATSNAGVIHATANGTSGGASFGISNYSQGYVATVDNSGSISATSTSPGIALATGVENESALNSAYFSNSGSISASADSGSGTAAVWGVVDTSGQSSDITNEVGGVIDVVASSQDGYALAVGAYAIGTITTTLTNYGAISARSSSANGDATAYAAVINAGYTGIGLLTNGGDLSAEASAGAGATAYAAAAIVVADVASIFNDATASATATAGAGGTAIATGANAYGLNSAVSNYGELSAHAIADGGTASATGASVYGYFGSAFYNAGDIGASAAADGGLASVTGVSSIGIFGAYATNNGAITTQATGDSANAVGLLNAAVYLGDAIVTNSGSISAVADGGIAAYGEVEATAIGVYNFALFYDSVVDNTGSIYASASALADIAPTEGFLQAKAIGAQATNGYGYLDAVVVNSGEIGASAEVSTGYAVAWGAVAQSPGVYGGISLIENDGSIWSYAHTDIGMAIATGAYTVNALSTSEIINHGDIVATARAERGITDVALDFAIAYGARSRSYYENATIANYGRIESHASVVGGIAYSYGVIASGGYANVHNAAGASITATVETELFGGAFVNGVTAGGLYGVDVINDGSITAYASASGYLDETGVGHYGASGSTGIVASGSVMGDALVVNNGVVNAIAIAHDAPSVLEGGAGAVGIDGYGNAVTIANAGSVNAIAQAEFGVASTSGINAHGKYSNDITNAAGASIVSYASAGSLPGDSQPAFAVAWGTQSWGADYASTYNAGRIVAHAVATPDDAAAHGGSAAAYGSTVGRYSGIVTSALVNMGDIEATADADFGYATTYGVYVHGLDEATISNAGSIRASAIATGGNAFAVGSHAYSLNASVTYNCDAYGCDWANPIVTLEGGEALIDNAGDIVATASSVGGVGYSYGAATFAAFAAGITNTGHITAITEADDAMATAAVVTSFYGDAALVNGGDIVASATGAARADAVGAIIRGANGARIDNTGRILAGAYGVDATATAVSMGDTGSNVLTNTGTIAALGDGTRIAIASGAGATASIANQGSITGAVVTGDFDDSFDNAAGATWVALGESDFGAGDNHIVNKGTIMLDDASIVLSGHSDGVSAAFAAIQPASHISGSTFENTGTLFVSGSGNVIDTGAFTNDGIISFVDGAADDVLTIVGDFSGDGVINLDVSGLHQTSDQLYVDGSIITPTTQTLNVNLVDLPTAPNTEIALITTNGTLAGDFVLGNMQFAQDGFVSMDFGLNVSADTVSLGVDVTGLNATGSLAAVVAPGVQSLVNSQVGTFRQRMGVVPEMGEAGLGPWMRMFSESGDVDARYSGNFGADALGFHQSNHGWEVGLDTRPSEHVAFGAFIAKSDGSQDVGGAGSNRFDGRTFGLYGTWFGGHGAYIDVSQRWTGVDARLRSAMGTHTTKASAQSFNVEGGFTAWTSEGGLNVVPQLQYTRTRISDIRTLHASQAEFVNEGGVSSRGRLGVALDQSFQSGGFTLTPYGSLNVVREFDGDFDHAVNDGLQGSTSTDGTSAMVELGMGARKGGLSISGGASWIDGGAVNGTTGAQLTVRYSW